MDISIQNIHEAILNSTDEGLTIDKIKKSFREVYMEEKEKQDNINNELFDKRNPFRASGAFSRKSSQHWNVASARRKL